MSSQRRDPGEIPSEPPVYGAAREGRNSAPPLPRAHHLVPFLKRVGQLLQHDTITELETNINCVRHCAKVPACTTDFDSRNSSMGGEFRYSCMGIRKSTSSLS